MALSYFKFKHRVKPYLKHLKSFKTLSPSTNKSIQINCPPTYTTWILSLINLCTFLMSARIEKKRKKNNDTKGKFLEKPPCVTRNLLINIVL